MCICAAGMCVAAKRFRNNKSHLQHQFHCQDLHTKLLFFSPCIHTCVYLQTTALAGEQRRGAVLLQQRVGWCGGAVLLPEGKADLWDEGLRPPQTSTVENRAVCWSRSNGSVRSRGVVFILCFVFRLSKKM